MYLDRCVDIILSGLASGVLTSSTTVLSNIKFSGLNLDDCRKLLHTISSRMPVPNKVLPAILSLVARIWETPAFVGQLSAESNPAEMYPKTIGALRYSPIWEEIEVFISAALRPCQEEDSGQQAPRTTVSE
jgi:hypothetical protein